MKTASLLLLLIISCFSHSQNKPRTKHTKPIIGTYFHVRNAQYGYDYMLPSDVSKELVETSGTREVSIYHSSDRTYTIRIFSENTFEASEKTQMLKDYYQKIISGNHEEVKNIILLEKKINTKNGTFYLKGKMSGKEFIWKTYVSEIPVSGEFICNSMLFLYSNPKRQSIGKELADRFGSK